VKKVDFIQNIEEAIDYYSMKGNWFKVCKRMFSLYNFKLQNKDNKLHSVQMLEKLFHILNSDLGILYLIHGDIEVLMYLIKHHDDFKTEYLKQEVAGFIGRLANVYSINSYLKQEPKMLEALRNILTMKDQNKIGEKLDAINDNIMDILNEATKERMSKVFV
jgi:hypothetical protein